MTTKTTSTTVTLSSNSGTGKFAATSGGTATTTVSIPANQSSVTAYYGDTTVGTPTITASSSPLTPASQIETITVAPDQARVHDGAVSGNAYKNASLGPITVTEEASNGTLTTVGVTVNLSSNSRRDLHLQHDATAPPRRPARPRDHPGRPVVGDLLLRRHQSGISDDHGSGHRADLASQTETVNVGPIARSSLSTPGTQTAGTPFSETITAVDAGGNTVTGYNGVNCLTFSGPANSPNGTAPAYPALGGCLHPGRPRLTLHQRRRQRVRSPSTTPRPPPRWRWSTV